MTRSRKPRFAFSLVIAAFLALGIWALIRDWEGGGSPRDDEGTTHKRLTTLPNEDKDLRGKPLDYPGQSLTREHTALILKKFGGIDLPEDAEEVASGVEPKGPGTHGLLSFKTDPGRIPGMMEAISEYWLTNGQVAKYRDHPERPPLTWEHSGLEFIPGVDMGGRSKELFVCDSSTSLVLPEAVNRALGLRPAAQTRDFYLFFHACPTTGYLRVHWQHYPDGPYGDAE